MSFTLKRVHSVKTKHTKDKNPHQNVSMPKELEVKKSIKEAPPKIEVKNTSSLTMPLVCS